MKNLTSTFKTIFIIYIILFLLGIFVSCIFGVNTFATLGKGGQQLVFEISENKENYDAEIKVVKSYLKEKGATMIVAQTSYNAFDEVDSLIFTFKTEELLENSVRIAGVDCQVSNINNDQATRAIVRASIGLGVAIVLMFAYMALRHLRNNWLAYSLGSVFAVLLNCFAFFGLVQIAGLFGYQFDVSIVGAFLFVILMTAVAFVATISLASDNADSRKIAFAEGLKFANKTLSVYYWIFAIVIIAISVVLSVLYGGAFAIRLIPIAIASFVCALSSTTIAPAFWILLSKEEQTVVNK